MKNDGFALITGASRGLGMAFARALAQRHCNLVLVARSPEPLRAFADELRRANPVSVVAIQVDLSTAGACQILAEQLSRGGIPIELLVNNAGFGLRGEFRANSLPRQLEMLRLTTRPSSSLPTVSFRECWSAGRKASSTSPRLPASSPFLLRAPTLLPRRF